MRKALIWLDEHLLFILTGFLLAFIPLYPKIPLADILPGYIVRVRLEDIFIALTLIIWIIQLWRKKVSFGPNPLTRPVLAYLTVGALSMISAVLITQTVPFEFLHISKMALHFFRRIEYFSLFFVFYSTIKSIRQVKIYLLILLLTIVGITVYGFGQKYLYWYAFSTMNREFSKGWRLILTQHARVMSTFGGHYDLAAYSMGALLVLWSLYFSLKQKIWKMITLTTLAGLFWILILTVSRTSFIAYIAGITVLFVFWMFKEGFRWAFPRWIVVIALSISIMLSFGDLSDRFLKLLKLDVRLAGIKSLILKPVGAPPKGEDIALLENNPAAVGAITIDEVTSKSDFPPLPLRPTDVTTDIPDGFIATQSASGNTQLTVVKRTYSKTSLVYDLSTGIRLDALWPQAIKGLMSNPLLGSGYSTLNKLNVNDFTEAESTDNDFLRALGETGILGFIAFGWILVSILLVIWKLFLSIKDKLLFGFVVGLGAVVVGLLVNAIYIDVFEASKVALSFWAVSGIVLGALKFVPQEKHKLKFPHWSDMVILCKAMAQKTIALLGNNKIQLIVIFCLAFYLRTYKINNPIADWHSWRQADTASVTRNYVRYGIDPLFPRYDDLSSVASGKPNPEGYRFVEFPLYNIASVVIDKLVPDTIEHSSRLTSIFASMWSLIFLYFLVKKHSDQFTAKVAAFYFAVLPYNIYWSRVVLPEPTLVALCLGMIYFFNQWIDTEKKRYYISSVLLAAAALLVKFTAIFFVIPMAYLVFRKWGWRAFLNPWMYVYGVAMVIPFILWRQHISYYPEGIPAYNWLFNGNGIRFKGAFFWWIFADRIAKMILGGWGIVLLITGIITKTLDRKNKSNYFFHSWLVAMILYLFVFATGNVQHDYYQVILVPILCIFLAIGTVTLWGLLGQRINTILSRLSLLICVIFMLMFGWYQARDLFNINHPEIVEAGNAVQQVLGDKLGTIIAPYGGDTAFLYQTARRGWPLMEGTIDEMINKGADYYVSTNFDELTNSLVNEALGITPGKHAFKILKKTNAYVIIQLIPDRLLPKSQ